MALADASAEWCRLWRQGIPYITLLANGKVTRHMVSGLGLKTTLLDGEETKTFLFLNSMTPLNTFFSQLLFLAEEASSSQVGRWIPPQPRIFDLRFAKFSGSSVGWDWGLEKPAAMSAWAFFSSTALHSMNSRMSG